jgi:hypothetical protein
VLGEGALTTAERAALQFYAACLPELRPREYRTAGAAGLPLLLWTDASFEPLTDRPAAVGFVAALPRRGAVGAVGAAEGDGLRALAREYDLVHGSAAVPEETMQLLGVRRQQIGQLELLAKLVAYASLRQHAPERLRRCDNRQGVFVDAGLGALGARDARAARGHGGARVVRVRSHQSERLGRAVSGRPVAGAI